MISRPFALAFVIAALAAQPVKRDWFVYNQAAPLEYRENLISTRDGVRVFDSSYSSPKGGRVRAYTVAPDRNGRFAGIVWQHGGGQTRNWFMPDAVAFAKAGETKRTQSLAAA